MEIIIKEKSYKVKYSIRAMMAFEQIAGKNFEIKSLTDLYIFCYSMVLAGMNEEPLAFDDFIDACDTDPQLITQLSEYMNKSVKMNEQLNKKADTKKAEEQVSLRELYTTLVVGAGISPAYVLDEMQWYEVEAVLDGYDLKQRENWEKVRTLVVASLQSNSSKRLKAQKAFPLPWDKQEQKRSAGKKRKTLH
ncbi:MAG: hypothetical protein LUG51_07635 [Tannerellaceae bacterium]|nr:hypothetical protein [Tannerellaceae bacterium]